MSAITPTVAVLPDVVVPAEQTLTVVCLCAAWCGVCRQYEPEFWALRSTFPQVRFDWLDVEDQEDLMGDVDVETFPTLLIGRSQQALFLGPLLPQIKVLERLITAALEGAPCASVVSEEAHALWQRVATKWQ